MNLQISGATFNFELVHKITVTAASVLSLAVALLGTSAVAQAAASMQMAMDKMQPVPRPDELPVPMRMTGIGNSHITIRTNRVAQAWFDQGLTLLHDFWGYEAGKAFEQAVRVDPACAMCYWGLFKVEYRRPGDDNTYALAALAHANRVLQVSDRSAALYIEAANKRSHGRPNANQREIRVLRKLVKQFPRDLQARIFLAIELDDGYTPKHEPKVGTKEELRILRNILRAAPQDSAANHYWVHALEPTNHPERALKAAARLPELAPNSGHMVHMPGHIYFRVGNYAEAERWFSASRVVDERYMKNQNISPDDDWNYVHNLMYSVANLMEEGKFQQASAVSDALANGRGSLSSSLYPWLARDQITRLSAQLPVALRKGDWATALQLLQSQRERAEDKPNLHQLFELLVKSCTGMDALNRGDYNVAEKASEDLDAGLWRIHPVQRAEQPQTSTSRSATQDNHHLQMVEVLPDADLVPIVQSLSIASLELRAGILLQTAQTKSAKDLYARAMREEKDLGYHEPPFYIRPVAETQGAALTRVCDYAGAEASFRSALTQRPNSGLSLYGLARAEELSGDWASARRDFKTFVKAWARADPESSELMEAKRVIASTADVPVAAGCIHHLVLNSTMTRAWH